MSQPDPDPIANHLDHLGRRFDRSPPIAQPEGYVLVQVKQLAQWREWANNVAAWSKQADRSSEVARLKASISNAMISATQPTASNAGERPAIVQAKGFRNGGFAEITVDGKAYTPEQIRAALATKPPAGEQKTVEERQPDGITTEYQNSWPNDRETIFGVDWYGTPPDAGVPVYLGSQPEQVAQDITVLERCERLFKEALPKFNWGASFLDANAIALLNEVPAEVSKAIRAARARGEQGGAV